MPMSCVTKAMRSHSEILIMRREVKIGVFAVVMLGCLWGGIRFLSGIDIFSRNIPYYVAYPEISGIQTATPVTIQGVKVGTVTAIGFDPTVSRNVVLQLTVRRSFRLPTDSEARIYSDGIMGGKAIAIEMGSGSQFLSKGDTLRAAGTRDMLAAAGTELADVKERLTRVMDNLAVTLESVNALLQDNKSNIDGTLSHLNSISGAMDDVLTAEKGSLKRAVDNIGKFSTALGENSERFSSLIANLDRFSQQLTEADIDSLSLGLRTTLGELNRTVSRINEGEGTVGKLMNDSQLYESLEAASANLSALLADLKAHPKRYVHFSIFGRRDKPGKEGANAAAGEAAAATR